MLCKFFLALVLFAGIGLIAPSAGPLAAEDWKKEYNELVAKAKQEGEVVVYGGTGRERRRVRTEPFEKKYGIKVSYVAGRGSELIEKLRAERRAGVFEGDIFFGRPPEVRRLKNDGALTPLKPLLFHPEVTDTSKFFQGRHWYPDPEQKYAMITAAYQSNVISFNTKKVKPESFKSMYDLFDPKYRGRIVINDPEPGGGASGVLVWMYVSKKMGPEYIRRLLTETKPAYQRDCRQAVDLMAKGVYDIALFCYSDVRRAERQGLPVGNLVTSLKEGAILAMGGSNVLMALSRAPHPNAQKLYVNWWFSKEGQIAFQELDRDYQSIRNDIPIDPVPEERRRKDGVDYVYPDAETKGAQWAKEANELWWKIRRGQ
ncbi:MAG: extracellular solute-binding protein [Deltaproteobacteria bacterium]|nr:extracellular solute-binding protein [Deltaproteobacteria bacterium]